MIFTKKVKQNTFLFAKIVIAFLALYFIYQKISVQPWDKIEIALFRIKPNEIYIIIIAILLSIVNWLFEIYKWNILSKQFSKISFGQSFRIVLTSFAISTITPNRVGEYGAKVMFYENAYWKQTLSYNFLGNMMQLLVTVLIAYSTYYFIPDEISSYLPYYWPYLLLFISLAMIVFLFKQDLNISLPWISKTVELKLWKNINLPTKLIILFTSIVRYISFSFQFLILLSLFENVNLIHFYSILALNYLLISVIPTISITDLLIKGSVSIFTFSLVGINEISIIVVVLLAWIFNFVLPTLMGIILSFKKDISLI